MADRGPDAVVAAGATARARHLSREGLELHRRGAGEEAERLYLAALALDPCCFDALHMLGALRASNGEHAAAAVLISRALALAPGSARAHFNLALSEAALGRHRNALGQLDAALTADPALAEAWNSRGNALGALGRWPEARDSYARAVALKPDYPAALVNLATRAQRSRDLPTALRLLRRAYELAADPFTLAKYLDAKYHACDWHELAPLERALAAAADEAAPGPEPFVLLRASEDPAEQCRRARQWSRQWRSLPAVRRRPLHAAGQRIRVAYLSSDFHAHATSGLLAGVLEAHDRSRVELIGVSWGPDDGSALRGRVLRQFSTLIEAGELSDLEVAEALAAREVDVLIDLKGYTDRCRPGIAARRPAHVQIGWLGYPGTCGAPWLDYFIADRVTLPEPMRVHFTESLFYLPGCYQPNDRSRTPPAAAPPRASLGLPESAFVFASFNNGYKLRADVFDAWMRLLKRLPQSVLWLLEDNAAARANLTREARARGIAADRLLFAPRVPAAAHFARQAAADLMLDTLPCNAHTTASDALAAGVPFVTCLGTTFAGRVAASVLGAAGLGELACLTLADYESLAYELATDPGRLARLKALTLAARLGAPLFDAAALCGHLEAGFAHVLERARGALAPETFQVLESGGIEALAAAAAGPEAATLRRDRP